MNETWGRSAVRPLAIRNVMLIVVSPAKTLDYESPLVTPRFTQPELLDQSPL